MQPKIPSCLKEREKKLVSQKKNKAVLCMCTIDYGVLRSGDLKVVRFLPKSD